MPRSYTYTFGSQGSSLVAGVLVLVGVLLWFALAVVALTAAIALRVLPVVIALLIVLWLIGVI